MPLLILKNFAFSPTFYGTPINRVGFEGVGVGIMKMGGYVNAAGGAEMGEDTRYHVYCYYDIF